MIIHNIHLTRYHALVDSLAHINPETGAEIGVRHGETSEHLLERFPKLKLTLVDPYPEYIDVSGTVYTLEKQEAIKKAAYRKLLPFQSRITWRHATSRFLDEDLKLLAPVYDFVFIDGKHTYDAVKDDIEVWDRHVRAGGIVAGHDYYMDGVGEAVREYAEAKNLDIVHYLDPDVDVWVIFK